MINLHSWYKQLKKVRKKTFIAIEQIDGMIESKEPTITFDLTISAKQLVDCNNNNRENWPVFW